MSIFQIEIFFVRRTLLKHALKTLSSTYESASTKPPIIYTLVNNLLFFLAAFVTVTLPRFNSEMHKKRKVAIG